MLNKDNFSVIIPARYKSSRLPFKILELIHGFPMIYWTYNRACLADVGDVIVAADDINVFKILEKYKIPFIETSSKCKNGTERIAEVSNKLKWLNFFINVQCDEPLLNPQTIRDVYNDKILDFGFKTAVSEIPYGGNVNEVKVAISINSRIRFASRSAVPFSNDSSHKYFKIHGVYSYSKKTLDSYISKDPGPIENLESVEQLRCIEYDIPLFSVKTAHSERSVDTLEDLIYIRSKNISEFEEWSD